MYIKVQVIPESKEEAVSEKGEILYVSVRRKRSTERRIAGCFCYFVRNSVPVNGFVS